jgi:hypothetical protein
MRQNAVVSFQIITVLPIQYKKLHTHFCYKKIHKIFFSGDSDTRLEHKKNKNYSEILLNKDARTFSST